jgi:hypothetical protein
MWHHLKIGFHNSLHEVKQFSKNVNFGRLRKVFLFIEDWILLALLGIIMSVCSMGMDQAIDFLQKCKGAPDFWALTF